MNRELSGSQKFWQIVASVAIIVYTVVPLLWIFNMSLKSTADRADGKFWAHNPTLENYQLIFTGGAKDLFLPALRNSIVVAVVATLIAVILATFCAYAIARLDFPGKRLILGTALTVSFFPVISLVTPLFDLWRRIHLFDTIPGLILPYLVLTLPLSIWTLSAFFQQIPWEMEQAAQVDGATSWEAFRKVIVPLAAPGVFTTAIIAFFTAWNDFVFAMSLTSDHARTVPAALAFFTGASQFESPTGAICAAGVVVTIPVVLLVLFFQRQIVSGLTSGAVKG
ncbi:carbohydrate ABC transporter permease [Propionibacterium australiense]|uniref:ABC transporter permease subunit n=1 Tax=Propionibacterium australiense TaxID=119981 RepID=A0A383S4D3_9ACTN|nr:carbohydrate ABC transporter permease [Propionibacterium australiense]RLP11143.1 ABC transporter permease subunit [Propionibacterium australiense]RLP12471.1 ABC transporter permease subunit [Propionibacterium australiense]SYZ32713.1 Binding-protein-dependent transport system inner membrane component [Propionibacterium australiense]VEH91492.1 Inner membrane ABC transporter permease protein ycjP [Propionibacterium australiense]